MMKKLNNSKTFLSYKDATIYFTYSFLIDMAEKNFSEFSTIAERCGWNLREVDIDKKIPERIGVTPLTTIYHKHFTGKLDNDSNTKNEFEYNDLSIWKCIETNIIKELSFYNEKNCKPVKFNVSCNIVTRIFHTGAGCITFKITFDDKYPNWIDIKRMLALSPRAIEEDTEKIPSFSLINNKSLYNHFIDYIDTEICKLNYDIPTLKYLHNQKKKKEKDEIKKEKDISYKRVNKIFVELFKRGKRKGQKNKKIILPEDCFDLYCNELTNIFPNRWEYLGKGLSPQNPNIYIVLSLNEKRPFWLSKYDKLFKRRLYLKNCELASLLLNIVPEDFKNNHIQDQIKNVRIPYNLRNSHGFLMNLAWDRRLFISIYRQISLLVYLDSDNPKKIRQKPENEFIKRSILDAVEMLHTRWYFSILLNALLDREIERIKGIPSDINIEILRDLITKRKLFAYYLHDPLPYRYWGGSVTDIITYAEKNMWLDRLKEMVYKKFQVIDRLYEDQKTYIKINYIKELREDTEAEERIIARLDRLGFNTNIDE